MAVLALAGLLAACGVTPPPTPAPSAPTPATVSTSPTPSPSTSPSSTPSPPPDWCATLAASLSRPEQVGQLLMVGTGPSGPTRAQARTFARHHVGSVILLGNSTAGVRAVRRVSADVHDLGGRPRGVQVMLAVDQEGGQVQRLRGRGFDEIPSAQRQAQLSPAELRRQSQRWAEQLVDAGVDADLAPVADLVPAGLRETNQPIGVLRRGYGSDPEVVARQVPAFVRGMDDAGVATAVKHFPGLGRVRGNTDTEARVVDTATTRRGSGLEGFRAAVEADVDMVMMSSATYRRIDADHRAAFSRVVIEEMLRGDLGFSRVVVSDDLAARAMEDLPVGQRVLRFLSAGGDLAILGDPALLPAAAKAVVDRADSDAAFGRQLTRHVTRVLRMKADRGLASC